tara:strand:- start:5781 stop:5954 length:174 start_codon:yes stop_codon:yes gene_type:complete
MPYRQCKIHEGPPGLTPILKLGRVGNSVRRTPLAGALVANKAGEGFVEGNIAANPNF